MTSSIRGLLQRVLDRYDRVGWVGAQDPLIEEIREVLSGAPSDEECPLCMADTIADCDCVTEDEKRGHQPRRSAHRFGELHSAEECKERGCA